MIRQFEAVINRMDNIVVKTVRAALAGEPLHITGPELNGHIGEAMFYSRPLIPIRIEVRGIISQSLSCILRVINSL